MKSKITYILKCVFFSVVLANVFSNIIYAQQSTFLSISDIHFDPFINGVPIDTLVNSDYENWDKIFYTMGRKTNSNYFEDTDYALFVSFLKEIYSKSSSPDFIIFTGDFLAHDFLSTYQDSTGDYTSAGSNSFIRKTFGFITSKINQHFPHIPIYFALGNNDSFTGDYNSVWDGEFFHQTADILFENFIKNKNYKKSFYSTYPVSGCYSIPFENGNNKRLISLNANFLSQNCPPNEGVHGKDILQWLENELQLAKKNNEKVWLINHIPPGINVYNTMESVNPGSKIDTAEIFMTDDYNNTLVSLIKNNSDVIIACFAGHIHMDDFRLFKNGQSINDTASVFIHITPSISPVFGNNSAFEIFTYDENTFALLNYTSYNLNIGSSSQSWTSQYDFNKTYLQTGINKMSLNSVFNNILNDTSTRNFYIKYYNGSSAHASIKNTWLGNWSGIMNFTVPSFVNMYNKYLGK